MTQRNHYWGHQFLSENVLSAKSEPYCTLRCLCFSQSFRHFHFWDFDGKSSFNATLLVSYFPKTVDFFLSKKKLVSTVHGVGFIFFQFYWNTKFIANWVVLPELRVNSYRSIVELGRPLNTEQSKNFNSTSSGKELHN